ncbi:MAG: AraC family transcriptional regulator [Bacteroidales bacterium]|nr:AraC family transcriptional regulator [Bacteroidales bacterium]
MARTLFSFLPFMVCFWWLLTFAIGYHKFDAAKRSLTWYSAACAMLYLCHAFYFTVGIPHAVDCLWTLCSLSVYPLYYLYICRLTDRQMSPSCYLLLLPAVVVAGVKFVVPCDFIVVIQQLVFASQVLLCCFFGIKRLREFDRRLADVYADMEGRGTPQFRALLVAIVTISCLAAIANALGRRYFSDSDWLLIALAVTFSGLQYALHFIAYHRQFTQEEFEADSIDEIPASTATDASPAEEEAAPDVPELAKKIEALMSGEQFYLTPNLKIADLAKRLGTCRTYVSTHINQATGMSFSDYVNHLRVEHAKRLMQERRDIKIASLAELSGFASELSFYRNFRKFTGLTPKAWLKQNAQE